MLIPRTLVHATQRHHNAGRLVPEPSIRHRGTKRARLERHHYKVAAFNLLRVVCGDNDWNQ